MSVEQTAIVDIVGVDKQSGQVVLTISDHLDWESGEHLLMLQDKVNTYLRFIESGELLEKYPDAKNRRVQITIVCKYPPTKTASRFLEATARVVEGAGIVFRYEVLDG